LIVATGTPDSALSSAIRMNVCLSAGGNGIRVDGPRMDSLAFRNG
jgi:hypothetical protein